MGGDHESDGGSILNSPHTQSEVCFFIKFDRLRNKVGDLLLTTTIMYEPPYEYYVTDILVWTDSTITQCGWAWPSFSYC